MKYIWDTVSDNDLTWLPEVVDFLQREYCEYKSDPIWSVEYFKWKLSEENPAGKGYISVAICNKKVIGVVTLTKKRVLLNGIEVTGGEVGDSYTSSKYIKNTKPRLLSKVNTDANHYVNKSIFGRLASDVRNRANIDMVDIIYGTPNKNAYPGWVKRLGYFRYSGFTIQSLTRPTVKHVINKFSVLMCAKKQLYFIDTAFIKMQIFVNKHVLFNRTIVEKDIVLDEEINELWTNTKPKRGFSLIRDSVYWRHRYDQNPIAKYSYFRVTVNNHLIGFIVARLHKGLEGKVIFSLVEWMFSRKINLGYVILQIMSLTINDGVEVFNVWVKQGGKEERSLKKYMFFSRSSLPIIFADTELCESVKSNAEYFDFYMGSSDAI